MGTLSFGDYFHLTGQRVISNMILEHHQLRQSVKSKWRTEGSKTSFHVIFECWMSLFFPSFCRKNNRELKFARTLIFTLDEINNNTELLPGVTLGYNILNTCGLANLLRAALEALNGAEKQRCAKVHTLIGHSSSGPSQEINKIISLFGIPQVYSYSN